MKNSHLVNLLRQVYPRLAIRRIYRRKTDPQVNFGNLNAKEEERAWRLVRGIYEHLFKERERTGTLFVILIPTYQEVLTGSSRRIDKMVSLCRQWNVPHLNLLPGLYGQKAHINQLHFASDRHFTPKGHAWTAEKLEHALSSVGIPGIKPDKFL